MSRIVVEPGVEGLGEMLAGLVEANLERFPERASLLDGKAARVNIHATDVDMHVGIVIAAGTFRVMAEPLPAPDVEISTDSETLLAMSTVPLRAGMPDPATAEGREALKKLFTGVMKVKGMVRRSDVLKRLNQLFQIA